MNKLFKVAQRNSMCRKVFYLTVLILLVQMYPFPVSGQNKENQIERFDHNTFDENSHVIDNEWHPLIPGTRFVYAGTTVTDEGEVVPHRVITYVTDLIKVIDGIRTAVTIDLDYSSGRLEEAEIAFYAQDKARTVWRMGEYPEEYDEEGEIDEAPCWLAGVDDARAGIAMLANPWMGTPSYSQGWAPSVEFTDRGKVSQLGMKLCVPVDCYDNVLVISETSLEEPGAEQLKYYAQGVGNIQVGFKGDDPTQELLELVDVTILTPDAMLEVRKTAFQLEKNAYANRKSNRIFGNTSPLSDRP